MIKILILSPASYATGGVELLHQLCHEMNKHDGIDAQMYYYNGERNPNPQPKEYERYGCKWVTRLHPQFEGVLVFPEILANSVADSRYRKYKKVIFWESVDNYFRFYPPKEYFRFTEIQDVIHLSQSYYATSFLLDLGLDPFYIGDYLDDDFFDQSEEEYVRMSGVLYNPKKGVEFTRKLIEYMNGAASFVPIENMSRDEVIRLMRKSKLYIDFGDHPGKDRLPREAAMCGCCIITGRNGAAGDGLDVPIGDLNKFTRWEQSLPQIMSRIMEILDDYDNQSKAFDGYRKSISLEKKQFQECCALFVKRLKEEMT